MNNPVVFVEERRIKILEYIEKNKKITATQICNLFNVSIATARNDLRQLEKEEHILRTHGGAMLKSQKTREQKLPEREIQNVEEKKKIAHAALQLIEDGDTIILDGGTTTPELAKLLGERTNLTVITNDLQIASLLEEFNTRIIMLGGIVRNGFHSILGAPGRNMLKELSADKGFFGSSSYSVERGGTVPDMLLAETKKAMVESSAINIILCDSSKFGKDSLAQFIQNDQVDILITEDIDNKLHTNLEMADIEVIIA